MKTDRLLIVVSGFSGVGKGTLMRALMQRYPEQYALSVSATSRKPRDGEVDGRDYFFKTREEFQQMIENDQLLEYAEYATNCYGTPKDYVLSQLEQGKDVILEIEVQGGLQVKRQFPDALLLFVVPPSAAELKKRLVGRGSETEEEISRRLNRAAEEAKYIDQYDYIIMNDDLELCLTQLQDLIEKQHYQVAHCGEFISTIQNDLEQFVKGE